MTRNASCSVLDHHCSPYPLYMSLSKQCVYLFHSVIRSLPSWFDDNFCRCLCVAYSGCTALTGGECSKILMMVIFQPVYYTWPPLSVIFTQNGRNYFTVTSTAFIYIVTMDQGTSYKLQGRQARDGHITFGKRSEILPSSISAMVRFLHN